VVLPRLDQKGISSKSEQHSFDHNRFCVSSGVKGNSRNMWFGQDWPTTVLLPSQGKTALNRTVFVFSAALKVIPKKCGFAKTGPDRYYFQVKASSFEQNRFCVSSGV
jgi:hypothetical protein